MSRGWHVRAGGAAAAGVIAAMTLAGCDPAERAGAPAATVTQSGDTTIIVPALDGPRGRLVSDLVIGADESNPDAVFARIMDAALGVDGDIYVVDDQSSRVSRFDRSGAFDAVVVRGGDGPGELDGPWRMATGPGGEFAVTDWFEIEVFGADGSAVRTFRSDRQIQSPIRYTADGVLHVTAGPVPSGPPTTPWLTPGLGISWSAVVRSRPDTLSVVYRFAPGGEGVDSTRAPWSVGDFPCVDVEAVQDARVCTAPLYHSLPWFDWLPDGRTIRGYTGPYQLDIETDDGSVVSLRPSRPPTPIGRELDAIIDTVWSQAEGALADYFVPPTHKPMIAGVLPASDGRIWVRLHAPSESALDDEGREAWSETESRFDIFSPDGAHLGYVTGPPDLRLRDARADTLLTTRIGPLGVGVVERFVVAWTKGSA